MARKTSKPTVLKRQSRPTPPPKVSKAKVKIPPSPLSVAFRHLKPSWRAYIELVETAAREGDKEMQKIISAYFALSRREQQAITPEQLCDLANVKTRDLFSAVAGTLWENSSREATMITYVEHPKVIKAIATAAKAKNMKAAEMFGKATGFVPVPKTVSPSVVIHNNPQTLNVGSKPAELPSMEDEMLELEAQESTLMLPEPADVDSTPNS